jgi:multicomponent Na+:H+ antiporter subunit E
VCIFLLSVVTYLLLVWSGGPIEPAEVLIAVVLGGVLARASRGWAEGEGWFPQSFSFVRLGRFLSYLFGPFAVALFKANIDVALRVISGEIRPGIVKVPSHQEGDGALTLLANSITLTPGTLTVDVDEESRSLYVHWIYVTDPSPAEEEVYGSFGEWARRISA